ncbi:MAG: class I SAM-dependent methyltransferase [Pseudomonadota bacterium]
MNAPTQLREDYHALVREDVFSLVPRGGGTLLDVGGGVGATAAKLRERGYADRAGVVDRVAHDVTSLGLDFRHSGDLEDGDFLDDVISAEGPFQCILCLDVLEHLRDPWGIVAQLHNALVPGGVMIASVPNVRNYKVLLPLAFRNRWTLTDAGVLDRTHLRFFVKSSAIELMTNSGLLLDHVAANPSGGRAVRLFRALTLGQLNSFTDLQYLIRVRRPMAPGRTQLAA